MFGREGLTTEAQLEKMRQNLYEEKNQKKYRRRQIKRRIHYVFFTIIIFILLLIFGSIIHMKENNQIPNVFGYYLFSVESGSMSPTLEIGDIFVSKKTASTDDLPIGTIVTYYNTDGQIVTHRITSTELDESGSKVYQTKGDYEKNTTDLELLTQDRIISIYCFTLKRA